MAEPMHGNAADRRPWLSRSMDWKPLPWFGGDEWCRRTLVLPIPLLGSLIVPLWTCRGCEVCDDECGTHQSGVPGAQS